MEIAIAICGEYNETVRKININFIVNFLHL